LNLLWANLERTFPGFAVFEICRYSL